MSTFPLPSHPRTLVARTALSVLTASLIIGTSATVLAQDQPWPKPRPQRPPAVQPKAPAKPKPAPRKDPPPAEQPPEEAKPSSPPDEAAPPPDQAAPAAPAPRVDPPAERPSQPPAADPEAPSEAAPAPPAQTAAPAEADQPAETGEEDEAAAEADEPAPPPAEAAAESCPLPVVVQRPKPPPRPVGPPVPPLATGPEELEWVEGAAIPPGYEPDTRVRKGLLIGGLVTFGVAWLSSAAAASYLIEQEQYDDRTFQVGDDSGEEYPAAAPLYVPVIGPFVAIGTMDPDRRITAALVADGVVQVGGVALALAGLIAQDKVLVRSQSASVTVLPSVTSDGAGGVSLRGSF